MVLEKTLESPLDCREIQLVNPKGNQPWIFIERTDAEAETPILWSPDVKNWLIGKGPNARKNWRQEEKGMTEDEMVGWHHQLNGQEFEQAPGVGDGQGTLTCRSPWGCKESDMTEGLNWTEQMGCRARAPYGDKQILLWTLDQVPAFCADYLSKSQFPQLLCAEIHYLSSGHGCLFHIQLMITIDLQWYTWDCWENFTCFIFTWSSQQLQGCLLGLLPLKRWGNIFYWFVWFNFSFTSEYSWFIVLCHFRC